MSGCGGGDDDDGGAAPSTSGVSATTVASYEGVYRLDGYTDNTQGCDSEGPSLASGLDREFVMARGEGFGIEYVELASCTDDTSCAAAVQAIQQPSLILSDYSLLLSIEHKPDALGGLSDSGGFAQDGTCTERSYTAHELVRTGDSVRIETRTTPLADKPASGNSCLAYPAADQKEAAGRPCTELRVITGTKTGPLPG